MIDEIKTLAASSGKWMFSWNSVNNGPSDDTRIWPWTWTALLTNWRRGWSSGRNNTSVPRTICAVVSLTGGKGPNNQWAHAEYIENPVNKWSQCVQWAKIRYIQNVPSYVNIMCPVGKCWSHLKCTQPCDSNVPRGYMVITFTMSPSIWSQCAQWGHGDHIHNVPSDGITMCSVGTCWVLSQCAHQCDHNVPSGLHNGFFHNVIHNVSSMSLSHSFRVLSKFVQ